MKRLMRGMAMALTKRLSRLAAVTVTRYASIADFLFEPRNGRGRAEESLSYLRGR